MSKPVLGHGILTILVLASFWVASCRSPWNADEFVSNTLSGRAGEISDQLNPQISYEERVVLAKYFAQMESFANETRAIFAEADQLRSSTRTGPQEVMAGFGRLAARSDELAKKMMAVSPPEQVGSAHDMLSGALVKQAQAAAAFGAAFARMDVREIRKLDADHEAAKEALSAGYDQLERDSRPLFKPGSGLKINGP